MTSKQPLLYISPVVPSLVGNGLAMRAARVLIALSTRYQVTLLVLARYGSPAGLTVPAVIDAVCASSYVLPSFPGSGSRMRPDEHRVQAALDDVLFDIVHVFRLATVPLANRWLPGRAAECWLDLDDVESVTHRGIAGLYRRIGEDQLASEEDAAATECERAEILALQRFDRIFLASALDIERLPLFGPAQTRVLPNVLPLSESLPPAGEHDPFVFLFVGTLGYFPNWEGVAWFIREIWPRVVAEVRRPVEFQIVGSGGTMHLDSFAAGPAIRLIGHVDDVRDVYAGADAAVVPLRAGGGTRIKVIEAFGYQRPVISTSIGVEGIDVVPGHDLLMADDVETFAAAMIRIMEDAAIRKTIVENAYRLVCGHYTPCQLEEIVRTL